MSDPVVIKKGSTLKFGHKLWRLVLSDEEGPELTLVFRRVPKRKKHEVVYGHLLGGLYCALCGAGLLSKKPRHQPECMYFKKEKAS